MSTFDQSEFDIRLEWGIKGVQLLAPISDVLIIVDVLSFSTCVDVALGRDAVVYPYQFYDDSAIAFAIHKNALLASKRSDQNGKYSLSPASLQYLPSGTSLVLPSPNGSTLSLNTGTTITYCGCLRNAKTVAQAALQSGKKIAVIPAGEKWPDGSLRMAYEDLLGAGAIITHLSGALSPEAAAAVTAFASCDEIYDSLRQCTSGKELIEMGYEEDVCIASQLNVSDIVPRLVDGAYGAFKI
ncbi:MAG: 2-phosphosulfolactate phosphatase [Bacteroidetes bacterium]|nr:2-phosphosulfolactate phosphatase [Bacteroidota bacterium]